jgi:tetratricopeptide (TPR) repeat protein
MGRATHLARLASLAAVLGLAAGPAAGEDATSECAQGKPIEARMRACSTIIDAKPPTQDPRAEAYRIRGGAHSEKANYKQAIADFTEAIKLKGDDAASYFGRGQSRLAEGDAVGAVDDLTQAIRYSQPTSRLFVARGYALLVKGDAAEAVVDFSAALRLDPKNAAALNSRGLAYRKTGDLDKAIADYSAAIELNPVYALAYNNRGYVFEARGDKQAAAADFRRALALDPALVGAKNGLKRLGEPEAVAAESDKLIAQGKTLAEKNCAWCHAIGSTGDSPNPRAPRWRELSKKHPVLALREPLTRGIVRPHDEMPKFELSDKDIDTIVAYINSLSP